NKKEKHWKKNKEEKHQKKNKEEKHWKKNKEEKHQKKNKKEKHQKKNKKEKHQKKNKEQKHQKKNKEEKHQKKNKEEKHQKKNKEQKHQKKNKEEKHWKKNKKEKHQKKNKEENPIVTEDYLQSVFNEFNSVGCNIPKNQQLGKQIYGLINFSNQNDAQRALDQMNGKSIDGYKVEIDYIQQFQRSISAHQLRHSNDLTGDEVSTIVDLQSNPHTFCLVINKVLQPFCVTHIPDRLKFILLFGSKDSEWEFVSLEELAQGVDLSKIEERRRFIYG
ncbi:MAG: hypothetical protein EZS28_015157, partial [Streblomastix strix]